MQYYVNNLMELDKQVPRLTQRATLLFDLKIIAGFISARLNGLAVLIQIQLQRSVD